MGFSRQKYWSGLSFPSPGDLPDPGIELFPETQPRALRFGQRTGTWDPCMGQGPVAPWRPSPAVLPGPAHLAHEDQRLSELSLADGTDVTSFCALNY